MKKPSLVIGAAILLPVAISLAQTTPAPSRPAFEVASIKLNQSDDPAATLGPIGNGKLRALNIPLRNLIILAYRIKDSQLSGAPGWLLSERYDIEAKASAKVGFDDLTAMLQPWLEDRLHLQFHRETKEMPVYSLTVSRPGKLTEAKGECTPLASGPTLPDPAKLPRGPCGFLFILPGHFSGQKTPISRLADALSEVTDRVVVDKTGLTEKYDIKLDFTPEFVRLEAPSRSASPVAPPPGLPSLPPVDPNGPSLFTALREQLGLKLESEKAPVEIIVIDHVERPSRN